MAEYARVVHGSAVGAHDVKRVSGDPVDGVHFRPADVDARSGDRTGHVVQQPRPVGGGHSHRGVPAAGNRLDHNGGVASSGVVTPSFRKTGGELEAVPRAARTNRSSAENVSVLAGRLVAEATTNESSAMRSGALYASTERMSSPASAIAPARRASSSGRSGATMVTACVPWAGPAETAMSAASAAEEAVRSLKQPRVSSDLAGLARGEVAQVSVLDEGGLGRRGGGECGERLGPYLLCPREQPGAVDLIGQGGVES